MEGKDEHLFYDGSVVDDESFLSFMTISGNFPALVLDDQGNPVLIAWLNGFSSGVAQCHFCAIGPFRRGASKALLNYWMSLEADGKPLLHTIIGITPAPYEAAWKAAKCAGFKILGEIPGICNMAYEHKRAPGVISYYARGGSDNGRR